MGDVPPQIPRNSDHLLAIVDLPTGIERGVRSRTASRERTVYRMAKSGTALPSPVGGPW
jgi:hypothetical protein